MRLLEERILADGEICGEEVLKVGSFLNQQIDVPFIYEVTAEFKRVFGAENVTKILTIEASGIGIACLAAQHFNCPVLFAKKGKSSNLSGDVYFSKVESFTYGKVYDITVSKAFISENDRVLIIDDFLAKGSAALALVDLVRQSGAHLVGIGIMVEKEYQGGGRLLRDQGIHVESLAKIASMSSKGIVFAEN